MNILTTERAAVELGVTANPRPGDDRAAGRLQATRVSHAWLITPKALDVVRDRKVGRPRRVRRPR